MSLCTVDINKESNAILFVFNITHSIIHFSTMNIWAKRKHEPFIHRSLFSTSELVDTYGGESKCINNSRKLQQHYSAHVGRSGDLPTVLTRPLPQLLLTAT